MTKQTKKVNPLDKKTEKQILKRLDKIHKKNEALFKEDKNLLRWLKRVIDEQQRKVS